MCMGFLYRNAMTYELCFVFWFLESLQVSAIRGGKHERGVFERKR